MSEIEIVESLTDLNNRDDLIELIQKQISSYGGNSQYDRIGNAVNNALVNNALKKESRSLFFIWSDYKTRMGAFVFANICSGLESGADYLWINELYVDESFRKRGVASQILQFIEQWSKKNEIVYIACSTGVQNNSARELYGKNGYNLDQTIWVDKTLQI